MSAPTAAQVERVLSVMFSPTEENAAIQRASNDMRAFVRLPEAIPILFELLLSSKNPVVRPARRSAASCAPSSRHSSARPSPLSPSRLLHFHR